MIVVIVVLVVIIMLVVLAVLVVVVGVVEDAVFLRAILVLVATAAFRCSFSAGSTPICASKYAFSSIFQNVQENHLLASKFAQVLQNVSEF